MKKIAWEEMVDVHSQPPKLSKESGLLRHRNKLCKPLRVFICIYAVHKN
jgi:hypothetical protein